MNGAITGSSFGVSEAVLDVGGGGILDLLLRVYLLLQEDDRAIYHGRLLFDVDGIPRINVRSSVCFRRSLM